MGKYFPKLTQTEVFIQTDEDGGGFNCPMLPVSVLSDLNDCSDAINKCREVKDFEGVRQRMIELVKTVFPENLHESLQRFDIPRLSELLAYLMFGDPQNDDKPKKSEKN
jgi:hypothetical protein